MPIRYTLGKRSTLTASGKRKMKVCALAQHKETISIRQLAQHIHDHGSLLDHATIENVLITLSECMREEFLNGNSVNLGDLGKFYISLRNDGTDTAEKFTSDNIKDVEIKWKPGPNFKTLRKNARFEQTTWRRNQKRKSL